MRNDHAQALLDNRPLTLQDFVTFEKAVRDRINSKGNTGYFDTGELHAALNKALGFGAPGGISENRMYDRTKSLLPNVPNTIGELKARVDVFYQELHDRAVPVHFEPEDDGWRRQCERQFQYGLDAIQKSKAPAVAA